MEVVLPGSRANDLPVEMKGLPWGPGVEGNYTD